jgi:hypothetical protein
VIWRRCVPVVAASELIYVAMTTAGLDFVDIDRDSEYSKRIQISRDDAEVALVWCTWVEEGTSVEFLIEPDADADNRVTAQAFREAALRRARAQGWLRDLPGFGREGRP